jgi:diguanylate cyclase (GGDEF)-like protein
MLGGLLTLAVVALAYALVTRSINSLRNLLFVVVTGASSLVRTGLLEVLFPDIPEGFLRLLKVSTGPLSAALVLNYLGIWLGGMQDDPIAHRITAWGSGAMLLCAIVLGVLVVQASSQEFHRLLQATAVLTMIAVVLGLVTSIRAAMLGDPLARWVVLAGACLAIEVYGLYLRSLNIEGFGLGTWILTAVCTVAYFLVGSVVVITRIRQTRQLERLARLQSGADPATGLPTGSVLLSKVEHTFWRTARFGGQCTVVCLHLHNLYELGEKAGHGVEHQILAAMAARIRRAAGFRCVVGLYHPRCFVVVISADKRHQFVNMTVRRLRHLVSAPLTVVGLDGTRHDFIPSVGIGVVPISPADANPMEVINDAERQALGSASAPLRASEDAVETMPADNLGATVGGALR